MLVDGCCLVMGIDLQQYREGVRSGGTLHFICRPCEQRNWPDDHPVPIDDQPLPIDDQPLPIDDHPLPIDDHPLPIDDHPLPIHDHPLPVDDHPLPVPMDDQPLDATFDMPHRRIAAEPQEPAEESLILEDDLPEILPEQPLTFTIIEKGSKRGGRLLTSSDGYTYGVKTTNKNSILWFCTVRSKQTQCRATVSQRGENFVRGKQPHIHPGNHTTTLKAKLSAEMKEKANQQIFRPAMEIVEDVFAAVPAEQRFLLPKQSLLKRSTNLHRSKTRPQDPDNLDFTLDLDFLQARSFLIADIRVEDQRHLVFATPFQMQLLRQAKQWFMDGTFRIIKEPFKTRGQLFSIHAFVQIDGARKQFPLLFAIMSRKTKEDYIKVFRSVMDHMDNPAVESVVLDFEKGAWLAVREVFPQVTVQGCVFHWTQAVWRHVQELGLTTTYRQRGQVHSYIRQLLALPFLPSTHIAETFEALRHRANSPQLQELVDYIGRQWMENSTFGLDNWSVFGKTIRTNNDVEGWHNRLNSKAGHLGLTLYRLIPLLRREAEIVDIRVTSADLERDCNRRTTDLEKKLRTAWDSYTDNRLTTTAFLKTVSHLYAPPS